MKTPDISALINIYGEDKVSLARYEALIIKFNESFGHTNAEFFSAPGRTEIIGNHTDHNGGLVMAASVSMDTIGAAAPNAADTVRIISEGYPEVIINLNDKNSKRLIGTGGTLSLTAGIIEAMHNFGFAVRGFDACISSNVISSAGVSSSASYEMLICSIINYLFNDSRLTCSDYARIGQYAENIYWLKGSGLLDQMACSVGGPILLDFSNAPEISYQETDFTLEKHGYSLIIVNTGKGHANLNSEYSEIPDDMKAAANVLNCSRLSETGLEQLIENINSMPNDRSALRAIHFFEENRRVREAYATLEAEDIAAFLKLINESGDSSWELLQNCFVPKDTAYQKVTLLLALSRLFIKKAGSGACRVHGGGFAGTIACIVPSCEKDNYINYISKYTDIQNIYPLKIRKTGAVHIESKG